MTGRLAFLTALLVSTAVYAYALAGIVGAGPELREAVSAQSKERVIPVVERDCERHADRVRL